MGRFTASWAGRPRTYDQQLWDHMVTIGATMNGTGLAWCDGEPTQGQYDWNVIDYTDFNVNEMLARGIEPTMFLGLTPQWAALRPDLAPHQTPPAEAYVQQFMDFHRFVAARYRGRVKYYSFWNEPNGCSWINGCSNSDSFPLYTKWLIRCSQAVKEMDPDAKIIAANIDYHAGVPDGYQYIQGIYDEGGGPYFDVISIHPYDWSGTIHWKAVRDTRAVMVANGDADKPVWITEFGWDSTDYQSTASKLTQVLTELKQPAWNFVEVARYLVLNDGYGVENYGLMSADLVPRAGYAAFRDLDKSFPSVVDFKADVKAGLAPLAVQFTDESYVVGATNWLWDFGDGQSSTAQHPAHTYAAEGVYTVRLTVTGIGGPLTTEKPSYVRAGDFPKVAFVAGRVPPLVADAGVIEHLLQLGLLVDVYDDDPANRPSAAEIAAGHDLVVASSTVLSGNIAGEFRHQPVPMIFWEPSLAVLNNESMAGNPGTTANRTQINVTNNNHPVMKGMKVGLLTVADANSTLSYCSIPLGSGVQDLATHPTDSSRKVVMAADAGASLLDGGTAAARRVMLFLYDHTWMNLNAAGRKIFDNSVAWTLGPIVADFQRSPGTDLVPMTVQFSDQSTGPVTGWQWVFGDGAVSTLRNPAHTYEQPGNYTVRLTVTGPDGSNQRTWEGCIKALTAYRGDMDGDEDVDQEDFGLLQRCVAGVGVPQLNPDCRRARLDGDLDVDGDDIDLFAQCASGATVRPPPACVR